MLKTVIKVLLGIFLVLVVLLVSLVTTIDKTPYQQMDYYAQWKENLSSFETFQKKPAGDSLKIGWAKVNLTPDSPGPMAGYGKRRGRPFSAVHDSLQVRTILLKSENLEVAIVSADLLIIPPGVKDLVFAAKPENTEIYFGATHSHNSLGGWYNTLVGELFAGKYDETTEKHIATTILQSIQAARENEKPVKKITFEKDYDGHDVRNRLIDGGPKDEFIRSLVFETSSEKLALVTYSAHSTVLNSGTMELSRDYPGVLADTIEHNGYAFATFLAGAVGSMGPIEQGTNDFDEVNNQARGVAHEFFSANETEFTLKSSLTYARLPLPLRKPSPKITPEFALRPWVFYWLFGNAPAEVVSLKIGSVLLVGLPCDFSGELMEELDKYAESKGIQLIITSFNGGYTGYITSDEHFDRDAYETVTMNWFGPYNGAYYSEVVKDLINRM